MISFSCVFQQGFVFYVRHAYSTTMPCYYLRVVDHANRVGEIMVVGVTLIVRQTGTRQVHLDLVELVLGDTHKLETNSVVKYLLYMC